MTRSSAQSLGDIEDYLRVGRTTTLRLSPDGRLLASRRSELTSDGKTYVGRISVMDTATDVQRAIYVPIDIAPEFAFATASTLIVRGRAQGETWALWALALETPHAPVRVAAFPGDVTDFAVAATGALVAKVKVLSTQSLTADAEAATARASSGTSAIRHTTFPVRSWDRDLGPHQSVLVAFDDWRHPSTPRLLTPGIARELDGHPLDLSADGRTVLTGWHLPEPEGGRRSALVTINVVDGARRIIADERDVNFDKPRFSPDGRFVICERNELGSFDVSARTRLWLVDVESGSGRILAEDLDLWPTFPRWAPSSDAVYFVAEAAGRRPVYCVDIDGEMVAQPVRLTADDGCYSELTPDPSGVLFALRGTLAEPPCIVELDAGALDQLARRKEKTPPWGIPGALTEVSATASDGQPLRGWLILPAGASAATPVPLLLLIHGGPEQSWVDWAPWGYNPWILAAQGYAVLLPDPAHSTGYGQDFIQRGWGAWGEAPYTDLMEIFHSVLARPDIDGDRTGAVGHSFGSFMANWIAGHDGHKFGGIVSHSGLYDLERFADTTDRPAHWIRRFGTTEKPGNRYELNSPRRHIEKMTTPMLVVHGARDYRVPVGESISLWRDLFRRGIPGEYLYFPDENHYILKPGNVRVWYETMLEFLRTHVVDR